MPFAQLVIGPPGSGKSTYCDGMHQFLSTIGRKCSVVNLDPANDRTSYPCAVDVRDLVTVEEIMKDDDLGPNGAVLYALEELEHNWEWLEERLKALGEDYVLFDCPGQVELFTHHSSLRNIFFKIQKHGYRVCSHFSLFYSWREEEMSADQADLLQLVVLHLTDSYSLTLPSLYISTLLLSLRAMMQMDLPHLNVLTKIDKLSSYSPLPFNLDFYTEVQDLSYLLPHMSAESHARNENNGAKFAGLNKAIVELVEDFGLVSYETLAVEDKRSMMTLLQAIDRAGGYAFGGAEGANDSVWQIAMRDGFRGMDVHDVQERWIDRRDEFDEKERLEMEARAKRAAAEEEAPSLTEDGGDEDEDDDELDGFGGPVPDSGVKVVRRS